MLILTLAITGCEDNKENQNKDICIKEEYNYERSNYDKYYVNCNTQEQLWAEKYREANYFVNDIAKVINQDGKAGIIDTTGQYLLNPIYHSIESLNERNVALARVVAENNIIKYGLVNNKGNTIVETIFGSTFEYNDIYMFKEKSSFN